MQVQQDILQRYDRKFTWDLKVHHETRAASRCENYSTPVSVAAMIRVFDMLNICCPNRRVEPAQAGPIANCQMSSIDSAVGALQARMMGKKALEAAQILVSDLQLEDVLTPQQFVDEREAALDQLFPTSQLMPGTLAMLL